MNQIARPFQFLANWLGGWSRLILLIVVVIGVVGGLVWERQRQVPVPPGATQVTSAINADIRQTTFRYAGTVADVRAFYRSALPSQGWPYCGNQGTPRCTNLIRLVDRPDDAIDVYRRANDEYRGSTIEVWPIASRRRFLSIAATGVSTLALAACGGASGGGAAATTAPASAPPTTAPAAAAATTAPAADAATAAPAAAAATTAPAAPVATVQPTPALLGTGSQKVTFWHGLAGADGATFVQMLGMYAASKPEVTISSELFSNWNDFYQKLPTATAAGTPPDLAIMHSWGIQQFASQGILQDADTNFYEPKLIPKDDFNPALIDAITIEGKTQAVPFDNHGWINWVNTKIIKDAGLDPNKLPANGTEFIDWAKKIVVDDAGKHPDESGFNPDRVKVWAINCGWVRFTPVSTIWQFGGDMFKDKKSLLTSEKTVAAMQYWYDLIFKHHVAPPQPPGAPQSSDLFKGNALALMWDGTWNLNFFKDNPDAQAVMQPMPLNSLAPDGKKAVRFDSHMLVVPNGVVDPNLAAAKDLIKWLSDNGETWATSGQVPARLSVQQKPAVQNIPSGKIAAAEFLEIGRPGPSHPSINEISTAYESAFSAIVAGTSQPADALKEAESQVQAALDRS